VVGSKKKDYGSLDARSQKNIPKGELMKKTLSLILSCLMITNLSGQYAIADSTQLAQDIKSLQAGIDSGTVKPTDAIDQFSQSLVNNKTSLADVEVFAKTQMTAAQFAAFQNHMATALNGIDPSTLTASETGDLVAHSLSDLHKEGLYWSGCASVWTGVAVIAAAVVVGVIAIGKSKSVTSIQSDYQKQISDTQAQNAQDIANTIGGYNNDIVFRENWKTSIPNAINGDNADMLNKQNDLQNLQSQYDSDLAEWNNPNTSSIRMDALFFQMPNLKQSIDGDRTAITDDINNISSLESELTTYLANPGQVAIDVANDGTSRDATVAQLQQQLPIDIQNLQNKEGQAVANAPSDQSLGKTLGIGAGIGAAIGTGLIVYGITEGVSCGGDE